MNNVQSEVASHLLSGREGSSRRLALDLLTQGGFFGPSQTDDQSEAKLAEFVEAQGPHGTGEFCDDGIGRLYAAIGLTVPGRGPGPQDDELRVSLTINIHRDSGLPGDEDSDALAEITNKIAAVVALAQGEGWKVTDTPDVYDWYTT